MEPKDAFLCSQQRVTSLYPEPDESHQQLLILFP
jgi:hypothetical protein